jgi:hypothetical protein
MNAVATCSQCKQRLRVPDGAEGGPVRCPRCGNVFSPPDADVFDALPATEPAALAETALPPETPQRSGSGHDGSSAAAVGDRDFRLRPAPVRRGGALLVAALLGGALGLVGVCCLGVGGLALWYSRPAPQSLDAGVAPDAIVAEPGTWTVLFRADDPVVWDTDSPGKQFAIPLRKAPATVRYVRLRRMDTSEALILPVTRRQLGTGDIPAAGQKYSWNGTAKFEWSGRHLGIVQGQRFPFPAPNGMITVLNDGWDCFAGSGFGHKAFHDDEGQFYCWKGQEIPRTAFEIAVNAGPLTAEDECLLLKP